MIADVSAARYVTVYSSNAVASTPTPTGYESISLSLIPAMQRCVRIDPRNVVVIAYSGGSQLSTGIGPSSVY